MRQGEFGGMLVTVAALTVVFVNGLVRTRMPGGAFQRPLWRRVCGAMLLVAFAGSVLFLADLIPWDPPLVTLW